MLANPYFYSFSLGLLGLIGAIRLACFFAMQIYDPVFRSFLIYFVIVALGFAWLVFADMNALAGQPMLATSSFRPIIFRGLFVAGIYQLMFHLLWRKNG